MANTKVSALTAAGSALGADEIPVNEAGTSKKVTVDQILTYLQTKGMPRVFKLASDHAISSTTATEVTGLGPVTLEAGTYMFQYYLLVQSATTTVSPMYGINFTGTATVKAFRMRYPGTGTTAITGVADDVGATSGQIEESQEHNAYSTTAPNMGHTGGVATINTSILVMIEGLIVVTASGDLELWHGSETATSTTIMTGSAVSVTRVA